MVTLNIDGKKLEAEEGQTILEVARENGIDIPTLCYHENLAPYGACRLCIVEIFKNGRSRLVASCLYPVEEGLEVKANSPRVMNNRKMIMELLLARCSQNRIIKELASSMGAEQPPFKSEYLEDNDCILCGLCVRACEQIVERSAISLVNRGVNREVAPPFFEPASTCIGCGSCAYVCPTGAIKMEDKKDNRILYARHWKKEFKLKKCKTCGKYWAPEEQVEYMRERANLPLDFFDVCPDCR
ncbi:MAG: (2Fe-2S)-binding protein [Dehalococcoidia bacterium]|nr:(2Fe-2S)-binding protein [Dehalococcoidia bacterium]